MIKTILVPASGSDTDAIVFDTALAAARPCRAHLEFFHLRVSSGAALQYTPHVGFARGKALHNVLQDLHKEAEQRSNAAERHIRDFCQRHKITVADAPVAFNEVSASWHEERGDGEEPFITRARLHDLLVMGALHASQWIAARSAASCAGRMRSSDFDCGAAGAADAERHRDDLLEGRA